MIVLLDMMNKDSDRYISVLSLINLITKHTNDKADTAIKYLAKYSFGVDKNIDLYLHDSIFDTYEKEYLFVDLFMNFDKLPNMKDLIEDEEILESYFLKEEIFQAHCIKSLGIEITQLNIPTLTSTKSSNFHSRSRNKSRNPNKPKPISHNLTGSASTLQNTKVVQAQEVTEQQNQHIYELEELNKSNSGIINIPFGKRLDMTNRSLPIEERLKQSYETYSHDFSFYDDMHAVNTPDEMIKRIQGLLKVIREKDLKVKELEKQLKQVESRAPVVAKSRVQDPKLIAMMAILLADKNSKYKWGEKPNKSAIEKDIHELIESKFFVDNKHTHGLEAPHKRIADCLSEFSDFFYTALNTKKH